MVTILHWRLGLTTKPRAERDTFFDALNGGCTWQGVDKNEVQTNIINLLRQYQVYLRENKEGDAPGDV